MSDNMNPLSDFERSTIGELGNIAMGAGATASLCQAELSCW